MKLLKSFLCHPLNSIYPSALARNGFTVYNLTQVIPDFSPETSCLGQPHSIYIFNWRLSGESKNSSLSCRVLYSLTQCLEWYSPDERIWKEFGKDVVISSIWLLLFRTLPKIVKMINCSHVLSTICLTLYKVLYRYYLINYFVKRYCYLTDENKSLAKLSPWPRLGNWEVIEPDLNPGLSWLSRPLFQTTKLSEKMDYSGMHFSLLGRRKSHSECCHLISVMVMPSSFVWHLIFQKSFHLHFLFGSLQQLREGAGERGDYAYLNSTIYNWGTSIKTW